MVVQRCDEAVTKTEIIYNKLREVARQETLISYEKVGKLVGLDMDNWPDRNELAGRLGEISTKEHEAGRPMLSAVVVHKGGVDPGKGFFTLAKELGTYFGPDEVFHAQELKAVYEAHKAT